MPPLFALLISIKGGQSHMATFTLTSGPDNFSGPPGTYTYWHDSITVGKELYSSTHFQGGNLLFCDGHAEFRQRLKLRSGDFGLKPADDTQITGWSGNSYQSAF